MLVGNLRIMRVAYWVNVSESSGPMDVLCGKTSGEITLPLVTAVGPCQCLVVLDKDRRVSTSLGNSGLC